jgi:hypothetical protein
MPNELWLTELETYVDKHQLVPVDGSADTPDIWQCVILNASRVARRATGEFCNDITCAFAVSPANSRPRT